MVGRNRVCRVSLHFRDGEHWSLEVTNGTFAPEYPRREVSIVCSASCEASTDRDAGINVELDQVPAIVMNDEGAIHGGEEPIKPG